MSSRIDLGEDIGRAVVVIGGVEVSIDLYEANNRIYELATEFREKPTHEYHAALVNYIQSLGFPACSHYLADRFGASVVQAVEDLKKKAGGEQTPGSPASTAQQS